MQHAALAARPLPAAALSAVLVLTAAACSTGGRGADRPAGTASATPQSPAALPPATVPPVLTRGQARAALITAADLEGAWEPTRGAATWRDAVLKSTAERPDCARLLDVLYTEDLFGAATAPRAATALDEVTGGAQLHYRITSHRAADIDGTLAWLGTLADTCGHFTARAARGAPPGRPGHRRDTAPGGGRPAGPAGDGARRGRRPHGVPRRRTPRRRRDQPHQRHP
ncbi:hypothetical protein ACFFKE_12920 [Streptomyces mutabilis]|uniref:hypothetical protein n=1 Tax=Streptomyces mutabilis TaxID=67332 RepID=UPI0035E8EAD7